MVRKILLTCGILSSLLYVAMNIFVAMLWEGYNSATQTVSELSAIGAPTRVLWVLLGIVYTLLVTAFGLGILKSAGRNHPLRMLSVFVIAYGVVGLAWPFAPMHQREILSVGGETLTDTVHIVLTIVTVSLMLATIVFGTAALSRRFRLYSIATILILFVFGALTGSDASRLEANLPTPLMGVWERVSIGAYLLWVVVLAIVPLRHKRVQMQLSTSKLLKHEWFRK